MPSFTKEDFPVYKSEISLDIEGSKSLDPKAVANGILSKLPVYVIYSRNRNVTHRDAVSSSDLAIFPSPCCIFDLEKKIFAYRITCPAVDSDHAGHILVFDDIDVVHENGIYLLREGRCLGYLFSCNEEENPELYAYHKQWIDYLDNGAVDDGFGGFYPMTIESLEKQIRDDYLGYMESISMGG